MAKNETKFEADERRKRNQPPVLNEPEPNTEGMVDDRDLFEGNNDGSAQAAAGEPAEFGGDPDAPDVSDEQQAQAEGDVPEETVLEEDDEPVEHEVLTQDAIFSDEHEVTKGDKGTEEEPVVKRNIGDRVMMKPSHARQHAARGVGLKRVEA